MTRNGPVQRVFGTCRVKKLSLFSLYVVVSFESQSTKLIKRRKSGHLRRIFETSAAYITNSSTCSTHRRAAKTVRVLEETLGGVFEMHSMKKLFRASGECTVDSAFESMGDTCEH